MPGLKAQLTDFDDCGFEAPAPVWRCPPSNTACRCFKCLERRMSWRVPAALMQIAPARARPPRRDRQRNIT